MNGGMTFQYQTGTIRRYVTVHTEKFDVKEFQYQTGTIRRNTSVRSNT